MGQFAKWNWSGHFWLPVPGFTGTQFFCHHLFTMRYIDNICHTFITVSALTSVKVWERSCNCFLHLPIPPNGKFGTRLPMYLYWAGGATRPNFNILFVWASVRNIWVILFKLSQIFGPKKLWTCTTLLSIYLIANKNYGQKTIVTE